MATILFTWELGGGMGHVMQIRPLVEGLAARGHRVCLALRDLSGAHVAYAGMNVMLLQAPFHHAIRNPPFAHPATYPQIIADVGFGDDALLANLTAAWRALYRLVRPDLIVFDHSPTALLAASGMACRKVLLGSGFFIPPDVTPLPELREPTKIDPATLREEELRVVQRCNRQLRVWGQPPIERLGQLFAGADERFLVTFEELDHYPGRRGARYWGPVNAKGGKPPEWPTGSGPKVYAYLKNFPGLPDLLRALASRGLPTLVMVDGIDARLQKQLACPSLKFERQRLDPDRVAEECDLAILNGNHGTLTSVLLAGKPSLHVPLFLEQGIVARRVKAFGAGLDAPPRDGKRCADQLSALLDSGTCRDAANAFRARYERFDPAEQQRAMLERVHDFL